MPVLYVVPVRRRVVGFALFRQHRPVLSHTIRGLFMSVVFILLVSFHCVLRPRVVWFRSIVIQGILPSRSFVRSYVSFFSFSFASRVCLVSIFFHSSSHHVACARDVRLPMLLDHVAPVTTCSHSRGRSGIRVCDRAWWRGVSSGPFRALPPSPPRPHRERPRERERERINSLPLSRSGMAALLSFLSTLHSPPSLSLSLSLSVWVGEAVCPPSSGDGGWDVGRMPSTTTVEGTPHPTPPIPWDPSRCSSHPPQRKTPRDHRPPPPHPNRGARRVEEDNPAWFRTLPPSLALGGGGGGGGAIRPSKHTPRRRRRRRRTNQPTNERRRRRKQGDRDGRDRGKELHHAGALRQSSLAEPSQRSTRKRRRCHQSRCHEKSGAHAAQRRTNASALHTHRTIRAAVRRSLRAKTAAAVPGA